MKLEPKQRHFVHDGLRFTIGSGATPRRDLCFRPWRSRSRAKLGSVSRGIARARGAIKHAVALDLRGHGDSEWPNHGRGYQHEDFLTDLAGLLKHLDKES